MLSPSLSVPSLSYLLSAALQNDLQLLPCCHVGIVLLAILMNLQQVAYMFEYINQLLLIFVSID